MSATSAKTASCLCGGVKLEIHGAPVMQNLCHCSSCQKSTGAAFGSMAAYKAEQVILTESEPSMLKTYVDKTPESGRVLKRSFCGNCGSPVKSLSSAAPGNVVVPIGIIDGDKDAFRPQMEFYCRGKADWVGAIENVKTFDAMPPTYPPQ
ncbi:Mss4-like protein [Xylaria venustula]|nr:Mss4-like protein [Xylaria venustula]